MPVYYFHVSHADGVIEDQEGTSLGDMAAALSEARLSGREILIEALRSGDTRMLHSRISIANSGGKILDAIELRTLLD